MSFARLRAADWVAFVAALALLFATAADWYSTEGGRQAREFEQGAPARGEGAELADDAAAAAEGEERNAWQADGAIDRAILVALLGTAALAIVAAFARAAGRRSEDGVGLTAWAGMAAALTALLVLYRVIQEPGFDEVNTVQFGAPLALGLLGVIAFASAMSVRAEEEDGEGTGLPEVNTAT
jgi:drug/metabolite transporter (DMT)-like permease